MVNNQYDAVEMFDGWMDFAAGQEDTLIIPKSLRFLSDFLI